MNNSRGHKQKQRAANCYSIQLVQNRNFCELSTWVLLSFLLKLPLLYPSFVQYGYVTERCELLEWSFFLWRCSERSHLTRISCSSKHPTCSFMARSRLIMVNRENLLCKVTLCFLNFKLFTLEKNSPVFLAIPLWKHGFFQCQKQLCCLTLTKRAFL